MKTKPQTERENPADTRAAMKSDTGSLEDETFRVMAGGIAHDFNNILSTISGYAEMLREDFPGDDPVRGKAEKILLAVSRARSLTDQLLMVSRNLEQKKIRVDVNQVLKETCEFADPGKSSGITLRVRCCREAACLDADPVQLFRVFLNLLSNAIRAMEGKGGLLSVSTVIVEAGKAKISLAVKARPGTYVLVRFRDTGIGMDKSLADRIFEPLFTSWEKGRGTGLGLSVVHDIISAMKGEVIVSSKTGSGSVFDVYLPLPGNR